MSISESSNQTYEIYRVSGSNRTDRSGIDAWQLHGRGLLRVRAILKRPDSQRGVTVDTSRARTVNLREETRPRLFADVFGIYFSWTRGHFLRAIAPSLSLSRSPYVFLPLLFRGASAPASRRDENSRMRSAAGCSLHNAVVTYRTCISLSGRGLTANTAGHGPIFSRDSPINGSTVISRLRPNGYTGRSHSTVIRQRRNDTSCPVFPFFIRF